MKFTQNTPVVSPNTINPPQVQAARDAMAYGTGGKDYTAMAGAIGQWAKVAQKEQDDKDAADVMEARNKIMGSLTENMYGEKGLLTTGVGENAKGLEGRVTDVVQKTFDTFSKQYNRRVQKALRGNLSENMANYQRIAAQQEAREFKKQKDSNYGLTIQNSTNLSMTNYQDENLLDSNINDLMRIVDYRAKDMGWNEGQRMQERRNVLTSIVGSTIQAAIDNDDLDTASIYNDRYGKYMNQDAVLKYQKVLRQETRLRDEKNELDELIKAHTGPTGEPDWNKIEEVIKQRAKETKVVGGGSTDRFVRIAQQTAALIRKKYPDASPNLEKYLYGQMVHETGNFTHDRALANNNFAGLHGGADGKHYENDDEYIKDYASFFTEGYHGKAVYAKSGKEFARMLSQSGWFTDPNVEGYGSNIEASYADYEKKAKAGGGSRVAPYKMPTQGTNIDEQVGYLKDQWKHGVIDWVGGVVKNVFGYSNPTISSAARTAEHNAEVSSSGNKSWHVHNDALDVVFDEGQELTQDQKDKLVKYFQNTGLFEEVLYHNYGSGWHLHLGGLKSSAPPEGSSGGGRTVNAHDSGYEDRMIRRMEAMRSDYNRRKTDEGNTRLKGYEDQLKNVTDSGAVELLERIKASEPDAGIFSKAVSVARLYHPDAFKQSNTITGTRQTRGNIGSGSGRKYWDGKSGKRYTNAAKEEAERMVNIYNNDPNALKYNSQEAYDNAARIMNDIWATNYDDNALAVVQGVWGESKGDWYSTVSKLQERYGMEADQAGDYVNYWLRLQNKDSDD